MIGLRIIGLTGQTGSGKSYVSSILAENGAYIIDADEIAHDIILKGKGAYNELIEYFGDEIKGEDGEICRKTLGNIVFSCGGEKLDFLNRCTHKYIYDEMEKEIKQAESINCHIAVIDAPLLIEGNFINLCGEVWVVFASPEKRAERIMKRDSITYKQALDRMSRQKKWEEYKKFADVVIDNSGDNGNLKEQVYNALKAGKNNAV